MTDGLRISRRGFLGSTAAFAAGAMVSPGSLFAQDAQQPQVVIQGRASAATAKISTQKLRDNLYALMGSGGNIAVLTGPDGKVLVDSGISTSKPQIVEALNGIGADPLTHLINTHWHYDHTDGNEWMHAAGATVIAQEKTKARLSAPQQIAAFNATFPAAPVGARPTLTFGEKDRPKLNGVQISMAHFEPAHTDTDIWVWFVEADVLHTGDTFFNGIYPFIDYSTGGNIDGMIKASERNLATAGNDTIVIPGHGPIGNKRQLQQSHDMLVDVRDKVAALKKQGKPLAEVVAAAPTAQYDAKWGGGFMKPAAFTGLVYQGV